MQAIIFTNDNGGVSTCIPTGEISIDAVMEKDVPKGRGARIVNITDLPNQYNDFYDAWEMDATSVLDTLSDAYGTTVAWKLIQDKVAAVSATNKLWTGDLLVNNLTPINGATGDIAVMDITFTVNSAVTVADSGTW